MFIGVPPPSPAGVYPLAQARAMWGQREHSGPVGRCFSGGGQDKRALIGCVVGFYALLDGVSDIDLQRSQKSSALCYRRAMSTRRLDTRTLRKQARVFARRQDRQTTQGRLVYRAARYLYTDEGPGATSMRRGLLTIARFFETMISIIFPVTKWLSWIGGVGTLLMLCLAGVMHLHPEARLHGAGWDVITLLIVLTPILLYVGGGAATILWAVLKAMWAVPLSVAALRIALVDAASTSVAPLLDLLDTLLPQSFLVSLLAVEPPPLRSPSPCWHPLPVPRTNRPAIQIAAP
jgi:hypothetical protein